ncbi:MAG: hypothetical protein QW757_01050 [Candidatus Woesearchaeota archaeon]
MKFYLLIRIFILIFFFFLFILFSKNALSYIEIDKDFYFLNEKVNIVLNNSLNLDYLDYQNHLNLKIISPKHYYDFLGFLDKNIIFQVTETGEHFIELYNDSVLIEKKSFNVFNSERENIIKENVNITYNNLNYITINYDNIDSKDNIDSNYTNNSNSNVNSSNFKNLALNNFFNPINFNLKKKYFLDETIILNIKYNMISNFSISKIVIKTENFYYELNEIKDFFVFKPKKIGFYNISVFDNNNKEIFKNSFYVVERKKFNIKNSKGDLVNGTFFINNELKKLDDLNNEISFLSNEIYKNKKEIDFYPKLKNIQKIKFKDLNLDNGFDLDVEDLNPDILNKQYNRNFIKAFAINPENLDFSEAILTSIAEGKTLYKCAEWDFFSQKCNGVWKKIMSLVPGQEYNLILTKQDPAYSESNEIPEPKPVTGFIFMSDNSRANNGIPVSIFNKANNEYVLTQVYAPPIPTYKGAYSANIYGITGDSIVVRSWNSTHYGETNSTLALTTTYVNVTIQYLKGSEPNVSIIYPLNNSIIYLNQNFNVTAKVQILNNDAVNCYASVISSLSEPIFSESSTIYLGNILQNNEITFMFNRTAIKGGIEQINVNVSCSSDTILQNLNSAKVNLTFIDNVKPEITIVKPLNNEESLNPVKFVFNVSDHTGIKNCSLIFNGNLNQTIFNPELFILHSFNLTLQAGTYNYNIECYDNSTLFNYNISEIITFFLPSWQFYYGNISSKVFLGSNEIEKYSWQAYSEAYLYVIETNTIVDWNNLQALGRNKFNNSEFNDFNEADINLSMQNFIDSINNTFTENYQAKKLVNLTIFGRKINNIPIINSTNNSNFITGILWEMTGNNYNGSQNLIFFTNKSIAKQGKFGLYEYEIRIPANLKNYKLNSGSVTFYTEII